MEYASTGPLVTIAIPTFNRAGLLRRAVNSVLAQEYGNLEILISDNASTDVAVRLALDDIRRGARKVEVFEQSRNLGSLENFFFLLRQGRGKYFMWLADDDELSSSYVSSLVEVLEHEPSAVTAMGQWVLAFADGSRRTMDMRRSVFPDQSPCKRLLKYSWRANDSFFYGLHRTEALRNASFSGYWRPNARVALNWAYVFLFDVVAQGRVALSLDSTACWINHDYSEKEYQTRPNESAEVFGYAIRRLNIYVMYVAKAFRWRKWITGLILSFLLPLAWVRDVRHPAVSVLNAAATAVVRRGR